MKRVYIQKKGYAILTPVSFKITFYRVLFLTFTGKE